ncbi:MAG: Crp/Fnr family transcriptional regulator [Cyclobacteriaceae bacterium]
MENTYCDKDQCLGCTLRRVHNSLPESAIIQFDANRIELEYKKGESICKQGSFASSIICIRSGIVKIYKEGSHISSTLSLKNAGGILGLQSLFGKGVYHYSAEALTDTEICLIDMATFKKLLKENPDFATEVIQYINEELIGMSDQLHSFSTKHIHGRLAELLLFLHQDIYHSNPFKLTLSKTDLSEILGTSKESISRLFKELKNDGIIKESNRSIHILDESRLKRISLTG